MQVGRARIFTMLKASADEASSADRPRRRQDMDERRGVDAEVGDEAHPALLHRTGDDVEHRGPGTSSNTRAALMNKPMFVAPGMTIS